MLTGDRSSLGAVQSPDLRRWRKEMAMVMESSIKPHFTPIGNRRIGSAAAAAAAIA